HHRHHHGGRAAGGRHSRHLARQRVAGFTVPENKPRHDQRAPPPRGRRMSTTTQSHPGTWVRYTPGQRLLRFALYLVFVLAIVQSLRSCDVIPEVLYDAPAQMADLLQRMWPVSWRSFPGSIQKALIETLHMATLGTILAIVMAVPVGLAVANNLTPNRTINL